MYQVRINSEVVADVVPNSFLKSFCRVTNDAENVLFNDLGIAAVKHCETQLNNFLTVKDVTITTDKTEFYLVGDVDEITEVRVDGVAITTDDYEIKGDKRKTISLVADLEMLDSVEVDYTTKFALTENAKIYIAQLVAQMYGRNEDKAVLPNFNLVNDLKIIAIC